MINAFAENLTRQFLRGKETLFLCRTHRKFHVYSKVNSGFQAPLLTAKMAATTHTCRDHASCVSPLPKVILAQHLLSHMHDQISLSQKTCPRKFVCVDHAFGTLARSRIKTTIHLSPPFPWIPLMLSFSEQPSHSKVQDSIFH